MSDAPRRRALINYDAFQHNVRTLTALVSPAETMIAVKADAYGHGAFALAQAALEAGATSLAVLDIPTALSLRAAGISAPLFAWMHGPDADFGAAAVAGVDLGISARWQLEAIAAADAGVAPRIHLKIDTGLSRNGATAEQWPALVEAACAADSAGIVQLHAAWSHLADASPEEDLRSVQRFTEAVTVAQELGARFTMLHLAASAAGIRLPEARFDLVRFGIAAYGVSPFDDETAAELGLRPVMTLTAPIVGLKRVQAGQGVSYGFHYRTSEETTLALVPLGYADGIPVAASGRAEVWINGNRAPVVGRIAMDQCVIDLGHNDAALGDAVVFFGEGAAGVPTAEEWAGWSSTIGDEIVARIGERVQRVVVTDKPFPHRRIIHTPEQMHDFAYAFAPKLAAGDIVVLTGELGAGKTTFTRGLGAGLGVRGAVTSPTFVLARTHPLDSEGISLVHVDAYRLSNVAELDDLDIDFARSIVVIEWGAAFLEQMGEEYLEIIIDRPRAGMNAPESEEHLVEPRTVRLIAHGSSWESRHDFFSSADALKGGGFS